MFIIVLILFTLLILLLIQIFFLKKNKKFYKVNEISNTLNNIYYNLENIQKEVENVQKYEWSDWPEKNLYANKAKWQIFPFKAFNVVVKENCQRCPHLTQFINSVPNVSVALLSRLGPGMKLHPHKGWGNHSNNVIRCHFGFTVPKGCYVCVSENGIHEKQSHQNHQWLCFDDSKTHYAENPTPYERIVLILDIKRPSNIQKGYSKTQDTKELYEIIKYYKEKH